MASFDEIDQVGQRVIEDKTSDPVRLIGKIAGDFAAGDDPDRPPMELKAQVNLVPDTPDLQEGRSSGSQTRGSYLNAEIWIASHQVDGLAWQPRINDQVEITGDDGPALFPILSVHPLQGGDMQIFLGVPK